MMSDFLNFESSPGIFGVKTHIMFNLCRRVYGVDCVEKC